MPAGLGVSGLSLMIGIRRLPIVLSKAEDAGRRAWEKPKRGGGFLSGWAVGPGRSRADATGSKPFDPGPQLDFPGPGASVLLENMQIGSGDGVRVERAVGRVGRLG